MSDKSATAPGAVPATSSGAPSDPATDDKAASLQAVGAELRRARRRAGLSLRELGSLAGLTPGFLSLVERGACSLSLTSLFALSKALNIQPAELIQVSTDHPERADFAFWPQVTGRPAEMTIGHREYWQLHARFPGRQLAPVLMRILPMPEASPVTTHEGEEFVYMLTGSLVITIRDQETRLVPGSAMHFKSSVPHTILNDTDEPVEALWVVTSDFWDRRSGREHD